MGGKDNSENGRARNEPRTEQRRTHALQLPPAVSQILRPRRAVRRDANTFPSRGTSLADTQNRKKIPENGTRKNPQNLP